MAASAAEELLLLCLSLRHSRGYILSRNMKAIKCLSVDIKSTNITKTEVELTPERSSILHIVQVPENGQHNIGVFSRGKAAWT
jgi:hypothetical protein